jgi:hypothetical protein
MRDGKSKENEEIEMSNISIIEVFMSDRRVGRIALTPEALCGFEYDPDWIQTGFSISPFYLPLKSGLLMAKQDPFRGNFGVFDDSLPDGWGNLLLDSLFTRERNRSIQVEYFRATIAHRLYGSWCIRV